MRLIDALELKRSISVSALIEDGKHIFDIIDEQPTIEPERKTGRWIPVDSFSAFGGDEEAWMSHGNPVAFYYCSECKEQAYLGEGGEDLLTNYCPDCGSYNGGKE